VDEPLDVAVRYPLEPIFQARQVGSAAAARVGL
jgi:hypothetical protein